MQSLTAPDAFGDIILWTAVVIALLVALWIVWLWLRKKFYAPQDGDGGELWSLQELRDLREKGQITEVEYQSLRQQVIGMVRDTQPPTADR